MEAEVNDNVVSPSPKEEPEKKSSSEKITNLSLFNTLAAAWGEDNPGDTAREDAQKLILRYLNQEIKDYNEIIEKYNILILYDDGMLIRSDADKIYDSITKFSNGKPVLLMLFSDGGSAGTAYLIGKLCREYSGGEFSVVVPRRAKSAATLICCAANEIHMGSLSELGPIDPQIDNLPALGLKNSIEHIAEMSKKYPESGQMLATYLNLSLKPIDIGYYERVAESAQQYAEKLLETHKHLLPRQPKDVSFDLVYKYKDHGFVIDKEEAETIFGPDIIKANTQEYEFGNSLYKALVYVGAILNLFNCSFYHIGSLSAKSNIRKN